MCFLPLDSSKVLDFSVPGVWGHVLKMIHSISIWIESDTKRKHNRFTSVNTMHLVCLCTVEGIGKRVEVEVEETEQHAVH